MLAGTAESSLADIYKSVDANGRVTYSSKPIKGAQRILTDPDDIRRQEKIDKEVADTVEKARQAAASKKNASATAGSSPSPATSGNGVARTVDTATQKARDSQRERILTAELNDEIARLKASQQNLALEQTVGKRDAVRIKQLEDDIRIHENNVTALQKEISRVK